MNRTKAIQTVEDWVRHYTHPKAYFHQIEYFQYCQTVALDLCQAESLSSADTDVILLSTGYWIASYANNPSNPALFISGWCQEHMQLLQIPTNVQEQIRHLLSPITQPIANLEASLHQAILMDSLDAYYAADQYYFWMHAYQRQWAAANAQPFPKIRAIYESQLALLTQFEYRTASAQARFNEGKAAHIAEIRLLLQL
jgi:hypothetical protein